MISSRSERLAELRGELMLHRNVLDSRCARSFWVGAAVFLLTGLPSPPASRAQEPDPPPQESEPEDTRPAMDRPPAPRSLPTVFGAEDERVPWHDQGWHPSDVLVRRPFAMAEFLTGPWFGLRERLYEMGFDLRADYVTEVMGNPSGGKDNGVTYTHNLGAELLVDLDKVFGWPGATFRAKVSQRSGRSLTNKKIGNSFNVQQIYGGQTHKMVNMEFEQSLWEDQVNLKFGRIVYNDEFQKSPLYCQFLNNAFCGNPIAVFRNVPDGVTAYPTATWGARIRVRPTSDTYVMAAAYDGDPEQDGANDHGLRWSTGDNRVFLAFEGGWAPERGLLGLPGVYKLGGWVHTGEFDDLTKDRNGDNKLITGLPAREHDGNAGFYATIDQTLYREGPETSQGLVGFAVLMFGPHKHINEIPVFYMGGLVYTGLIPGRPRDKAAFGFVGAYYRKSLRSAQREAGIRAQGPEHTLEFSYQIELTPYLYFRPDAQYIFNPDGTNEISDALALGFELGIRF